MKKKSEKLKIDRDSSSFFVIIVGLAAISISISVVISRVVFSNIAFDNKVLAKKTEADNNSRTNINSVAELRKNLADLEKSGLTEQTVLSTLPGDDDLTQTAIVLESLATKSGIVITTINSNTGTGVSTTATPTTSSSVGTTSLSLSLQGDYSSIKSFLAAIYDVRRSFSIDSININSGDDNIMIANIVVTSYYKPAIQTDIKTETLTDGQPATANSSSSSSGGQK